MGWVRTYLNYNPYSLVFIYIVIFKIDCKKKKRYICLFDAENLREKVHHNRDNDRLSIGVVDFVIISA